MKWLGTAKRELAVLLSKTCLRKLRCNYLGLDLWFPVIYGMGRGYAIPREIWMGECLDAFIRSKQGCVIDVGVNVGVYLVKLKVLDDSISYVGFEPNAVCNYYTNELIRMNRFNNARVLSVALSDKLGVKTLYASKSGDKAASFIEENDNQKGGYSSDIITVQGDAFIELLGIDEIAVIKIDVEGAELFVLNGLLKTIEKFRPFFYIEVWAGDKTKKNMERVSSVFQLIAERDYAVVSVNSQRKLEVVNEYGAFFEQCDPNYMFVPCELLETFLTEVDNINSSVISEI